MYNTDVCYASDLALRGKTIGFLFSLGIDFISCLYGLDTKFVNEWYAFAIISISEAMWVCS